MDLRFDRKRAPATALSSENTRRLQVAVQFLHAFMTSAVGALLTIESFRLGRDPSFCIGGAAAGGLLAIGGLAVGLGLSWLGALTWRNRPPR